MAGKVLHSGLVGASTLLGKELLAEIGDSAAAAWDLKLLDEAAEAEGQLTSAGDEPLILHTLTPEAFAGLDLVLFAGSPELTTKYLAAALQAGAAIVDLTGATEGQPGFLSRSPWIAASPRPDLTTIGAVTPHPAALMLAVVAERLARRFGHIELAATVLEPASQAGSAGVDELHQQTVNLLSFQTLPKALYDAQVAFTLHGKLGAEAQTPLATTRERIRQDLRSLLGETLGGAVDLTLLQAPVFHGYIISAHARLPEPASAETVRAALHGGIVQSTADTEPSNQAVTESGDLLVSLHYEPAQPTLGHWLLLAADNLRLPARNAVQTALELAALRPGTRVQ